MNDLVAIDLPAGPAFVAALQEAWGRGDAVAPIDRRLAAPARQRVLDMMKPARLVTPDGAEHRPGALEVLPGDALVVPTSGSSGEPKGVVLTHDAVAASARATSSRLGVVPGAHRWLACLPLNHVGGLAVVARALLTGTELVVHDGFDPARVAAAAAGSEDRGPSQRHVPDLLVSLVPATLARTDAALFHRVVLGGSAPPSHLPPNVVTTYGMTETGSGLVYDGLPLDGAEARVGPSGEVEVKGPMLFRCYRDGSGGPGPDGWFPTGDGGSFGPDGRLVVNGRMSEMIITGGENVWPAAVEEILKDHPGVCEVGVSSRPDPEWGETIVACVVPRRGEGPPLLAELRAMVRERLAGYAAPKELALVESLPRTAIGKLRRDELRRLVRS